MLKTCESPKKAAPACEKVSVIIPTYNEAACIVPCLESLLDGDYPRERLEFVIADGASTDNTTDVIDDFHRHHPDLAITIVENPNRTQGYGLNLAIQNLSADSDVVVRADAHSLYPRSYIADCVKTLRRVGAANVGGAMLPQGRGPIQRAVAFCMSHPLGVGNARFHLADYSGPVDTVYLGCFRREVFDKVGLFDPVMTPNEDSELNLRIRRAGEEIYLDSSIQVGYFPRDSFRKLIKQYFRYGEGRCRTFKKHRRFTSWRQIIPPLWALATPLLCILGWWTPWMWLPLLLYATVLMGVAVTAAVRRRDAAMLLVPLCLMVMHYCWGMGFIRECIGPWRTGRSDDGMACRTEPLPVGSEVQS